MSNWRCRLNSIKLKMEAIKMNYFNSSLQEGQEIQQEVGMQEVDEFEDEEY